MDIRFTKHVFQKIEFARRLGFDITARQIWFALTAPECVYVGRDGQSVIHISVDDTHIVRIVYKQEAGFILVVTLYVCRKSRYEK